MRHQKFPTQKALPYGVAVKAAAPGRWCVGALRRGRHSAHPRIIDTLDESGIIGRDYPNERAALNAAQAVIADHRARGGAG